MRLFIKGAVCIALIAVLTGCASSYKDTLEGGYKDNWESTRRPGEVAGCIVSRAEKQWPWRATQRPVGERGVIEVVITSGGESVTAIAHIMPSPYGSTVESYLTNRAVMTRDMLHEQFFGGC